MTPLDYALAFAARGWRVSPIQPGKKYPRINAWQEQATTDPEVIRSWWRQWPDSGVSIATGRRTGFFVIDVDPRHGGDDTLADLEAEHGSLPDTVRVITGNNGLHIYLNMVDGVEITNDQAGISLGPGLDIRGDGGQVVAPPSIHPITGRAYMFEASSDPFDGVAIAEPPQWLLQLLSRPSAPEPRRETTPRAEGEMLPGDYFAAEHTWPDLLQADGWTLHSARHDHKTGLPYELWTRPGKSVDGGASASLYYGGTDLLKVFTSSPPPGLAEGQTYTKFGYYAATKHNGDHSAAARATRIERAERNPLVLIPGTAVAETRHSAEVQPMSGKPVIVHNGKPLDVLVQQAVDALQAANVPPTVFVRAGMLCRLREDEDGRPLIDEMRIDHARLRLAEVAVWARLPKDGVPIPGSPPNDVVASVLAADRWTLPALAGVVELPVLRPDGTFVTEHGYDAATRLYHWHRGAPYRAVSIRPSVEDVQAAVALIDELLHDFPFDTAADKANAIALMLTPLIRPIVGQVPMALIDAPEPGTGKGKLVTAVAILSMGRAPALMAWPTTEEELEKKVTSVLMSGQTTIVWDNVDGVIRSGTLAAVLTSDTWQGRVLGASKTVQVPNRATWVATGNNLDVGGDLARRCYRIRLDARQAQPWKRSGFLHPDLERWITGNRTQLLHALCTLVRSWWVDGCKPASDLSAMGGYSEWVRVVGGILEHAGITGFLGNLAAFHAEADRDAQSWEAFLTAWHDTLADEPITVGDLINKMKDFYANPLLRDSLPDELADAWDTGGFSKRLGLQLRKRVGRHYGEEGIHLFSLPQDRRRIAIYGVTTRSAGLQPRELPPTPAGPDSLTSGNVNAAGVAGVVAVATYEKNETQRASDPNNSRNSRTPAVDLELDAIFGPSRHDPEEAA